MAYLPFIDGLRAIAIIAVVGFHAFPSIVSGGFAGVDVFFVISGFLITSFVETQIKSGEFSLYRFFIRRARRLFPALFVCVIAVTVLSAFILLPDAFWYLGRNILAVVGMYSNVFFYWTGGYFAAPDLEKPLLHTWSLAVEDQFYLTWPLVLMVGLRFLSRRGVLMLVLAVAAMSFGFSQYKVGVDPEYAFFMMPTRAWELLIGAALALLTPELKFGRWLSEVFSVGGLAAVLGSFFLLSPTSSFPGLGAAPACVGTVAIIAGCVSQNVLLRRALNAWPLVFTGLISYSLYLWHWPLLALSSYRLERPLHTDESLIIVLLSLLLAVATWHWVEKPFRASRAREMSAQSRLSDWRFVGMAFSGVAILLAVGGALKATKGAPERYEVGTQRLLEQLVAGNPVRMDCDNYYNVFANDGVCNFGRKRGDDESYEIALFGDSMSDHWVPLVADFSERAQVAGRQVTNGGCALFFGVPVPGQSGAKALECASYQVEAEKFIKRNPGLKIAVISGYWEKWISFLDFADPAARSQAGEETPAFDQALRQTLQVFAARGIRVVLIGQVPTYEQLPVRCMISTLQAHGDVSTCAMSRAAALSGLRLSNAALTRVAAANPNISVFLPSDYICRQEKCSLIMDGVLLYKNGGHVNRFGSKYLGRFLKIKEARDLTASRS